MMDCGGLIYEVDFSALSGRFRSIKGVGSSTGLGAVLYDSVLGS